MLSQVELSFDMWLEFCVDLLLIGFPLFLKGLSARRGVRGSIREVLIYFWPDSFVLRMARVRRLFGLIFIIVVRF